MLKISFDFDEVSKKVSNITVTESSVIKDFDLKVEDNKIQLGFNAIQKNINSNFFTIPINYKNYRNFPITT